MKALVLDIETSPIFNGCFGTRNVNLGLDNIIVPSRPIMMGYQVLELLPGAKVKALAPPQVASEFLDPDTWLELSRELIHQADVVIHYNGDRFDMTKMDGAFALNGIDLPNSPPSIDLYPSVKAFNLTSHKFNHALEVFGLKSKMETGGMKLWIDTCWFQDEKAQRKMEAYCKTDVRRTAQLFTLMWKRGLLKGLPNQNLYTDNSETVCPNCGDSNFRKDGKKYLSTGAYQSYKCYTCTSYFRDTRRMAGALQRSVR